FSLNEPDAFSAAASVACGPVRTANVISEDCECLVLDQASFFSLLGDLNEIRFDNFTNICHCQRNLTDMLYCSYKSYNDVLETTIIPAKSANDSNATSKSVTSLLSSLSLS